MLVFFEPTLQNRSPTTNLSPTLSSPSRFAALSVSSVLSVVQFRSISSLRWFALTALAVALAWFTWRSAAPGIQPLSTTPETPQLANLTILGQVQSPGTFALAEPKLSQLLARSGGPTPLAKLTAVAVLSGTPPQRVEAKTVDLAAILAGQAPDVTLHAGDRVFVPERLR